MKYGLGIDTGGTYTDAVIYDLDENKLLASAKSITIKEDLKKGINAVIDMLPAELVGKVKLVSLSTTLATNACVEGRGSRAKLVMLGCDSEIVRRYGSEYGLPDASEIIFLSGGHNQQGEAVKEPDWDLLGEYISQVDSNTDAYAVVELWGIKNPEYEEKIKQYITNRTGKLAVCGHELTGEVNSLKRAASALLNAQLVPLVNDFINAVKASMETKGIKAPLVIVRGDGSLMSEEYARQKPVETMISGPAASVAGGIYLTGEKKCIIVDMGGTTSDLAIVEDGKPDLTVEGANVGKWKTGIKSIAINTLGLGGDSIIRHNADRRIEIGPVRAAPLSWMASKWPDTLKKIREIRDAWKWHTISLCEFFYLIRDISGDPFYTPQERKISEALKNGPKSVEELALATGTSIYQNHTDRLERLGIIMRCGLTPTDIMHLQGDFNGWNREAAQCGAELMAYQVGMKLDEFIRKVYEEMKLKLYISIVNLLMEKDSGHLVKDGLTGEMKELLVTCFNKSRRLNLSGMKDFMHCAFSTEARLVGIGAPIHIFLPDVAECLNTTCVIPENAGVANAIGAITGNVSVEEVVVIRPITEAGVGVVGYYGYSSAEKREFKDYQAAIEWAENHARELALSVARERGADSVETDLEVFENAPEVYSDNQTYESFETLKKEKLLVETIVTARAVGKLKWLGN